MKNETKGLATKTPHPNGERKRKKERKKEVKGCFKSDKGRTKEQNWNTIDPAKKGTQKNLEYYSICAP